MTQIIHAVGFSDCSIKLKMIGNIKQYLCLYLSIPADLDPFVVIPWVEDVLGGLEGEILFVDPLNTENAS